jgi:predicted permease
MLNNLVRDARFAWRGLRKAPAFAMAAGATVAVAIGSVVAVFSLADAALLKPLPYPDSGRLGVVQSRQVVAGNVAESTAQNGFTWEAIRDGARAVDAAAYSTWTTGANVVAGATASHVRQQRVSAGFFDVLGVRPLAGRGFTAEEDRPGGPAAVVLGYDLWQRLYAGRQDALGATIELKGARATIVGVMPAGFRTGEAADLWTPLLPSTTGEGAGENYTIVTRLRDGVTWMAAGEEVQRLAEDAARRARPSQEPPAFSLQPMHTALAADLRTPILMLAAAVAVVFLVACVNLAGLLLARTSARRHELATRMALGSGRAAVVRQVLVECLVLSALGAAAGLLLGANLLDVGRTSWPALLDFWHPVAMDARTFAIAAVAALVAGLLYGIVPAWHAGRVDVTASLAGARTASPRHRNWTRRTLVAAQVALSVLLLATAGLLIRSFAHLSNLAPGFDPAGLIAGTVSLDDERYRSAERVHRLVEHTLDRLQSAPGIDAAAVSLGLPYERLLNLGFRLPDSDETPMTSASYVSPGYFAAMGIPMREGREFTSRDGSESVPVAIVSEAFARQYFTDGQPLGRRIAFAGAEREIVGVAGDVQVRPGWGEFGPLAAMPVAYIPIGQAGDGMMRLVHTWFAPAFIVRASQGPAAAATALRHALDAGDPLLPLARIRTMEDVRAESLAMQRLLMSIVAGLGLVAVFLAAVGLHGLVATTVVERTRETGIRLALGASPRGAMRVLVVPGLTLTAIGLAAGLAAALGAGQLVSSMLWGVSPADPLTFAVVAAAVLAIAVVASVLPARRILRLDPARILRSQ